MKKYLSGIDWIINTLDYTGKRRTGIGNISQVVIALNGAPDRAQLHEALRVFLQQFPLINGLPSRGLNLCPYWKVSEKDTMLPVRITVASREDPADVFAALTAPVNTPFAHEREHVVFTLVFAGKQSFLGMTFDHRLLDARGAETFLTLFNRFYQKKPLPRLMIDRRSHLDHWREKFIAGRQVNRVFLNLIRRKKNRTLPAPLHSRECRFKVISFDRDETARFIDTAYTSAGYLLLMPYVLAKNVQIMHRIFETRKCPGSTYVIPVSVDTRPKAAEAGELFFNHLSFFFFAIEAEIADNFPLLLAEIKKQMYEQVETKFPEALKNACYLLRIAPLPLVNLFLQRMSKKQVASFSFSFVGAAYSANNVMGLAAQNLFHLPRCPNPPGVGIFFNQFNGRINAILSYFDGLLTDEEIGQIVAGLNDLRSND